jgi:hypothetical protein
MESEERTSDPETPAKIGAYQSEPPNEPSAKPSCPDCLSLSVARDNARSTGDYSAVSDANVRMRKHQTEAHES